MNPAGYYSHCLLYRRSLVWVRTLEAFYTKGRSVANTAATLTACVRAESVSRVLSTPIYGQLHLCLFRSLVGRKTLVNPEPRLSSLCTAFPQHNMLQHQTPFDEDDRPAIAIPPPTSSRSHQRSRTAADLPTLHTRTASASPTRFSTFLPSLRSSRTNSPERAVKDANEFDVDAHQPTSRQRPAGVTHLASWFEGSSDPVNISLVPSPKKEKADPLQDAENMDKMFSASTESVDTFTKRPQSRPAASANGSRFSFFRKASQVQLSTPTDVDELSSLDIRDNLFPAGPPDEFSPAAFKNLQLNAEGLLRRFQSSHIDQQTTLRSLTTTKQSQADDLEACQTRNEHLKLQLVEMAERGAEQERLIAALRTELAIAHGRPSGATPDTSIRKVSAHSVDSSRGGPFRRNRSSNISTFSAESDESSNISVFSHADADDSTDSPGTSLAASPIMKHAKLHYTSVHHSPPTTVVTHREHERTVIVPIEVPECQKCHGVRATEAWDVVATMKAESQALKKRIGELEGTNDEVLDLIDGLRIS